MITLKYEVAEEKFSLDSGEGFVEIEEKDIPEFVDEVIVVERLNRKQMYELIGLRKFIPKRYKKYTIEDIAGEDV